MSTLLVMPASASAKPSMASSSGLPAQLLCDPAGPAEPPRRSRPWGGGTTSAKRDAPLLRLGPVSWPASGKIKDAGGETEGLPWRSRLVAGAGQNKGHREGRLGGSFGPPVEAKRWGPSHQRGHDWSGLHSSPPPCPGLPATMMFAQVSMSLYSCSLEEKRSCSWLGPRLQLQSPLWSAFG